MTISEFINGKNVKCHAEIMNLEGSLREVLERNGDFFFYMEMIYACEPSTRSLIAFMSRAIQRMPVRDIDFSLMLQKQGLELDFFLRTGTWLGDVAKFIGNDSTDEQRRAWVHSWSTIVWSEYRGAAQEEFLYLNGEIERTQIPYHYRDGVNGSTNKEHDKNAKRFLNETMEWAIELLLEEGVA